MISWKNFFDQPEKNELRTYDNIWTIGTSQGDDYTNVCLLGYSFFKEHYKMTAIDLNKQYEANVAPKAVKQINFSGNL